MASGVSTRLKTPYPVTTDVTNVNADIQSVAVDALDRAVLYYQSSSSSDTSVPVPASSTPEGAVSGKIWWCMNPSMAQFGLNYWDGTKWNQLPNVTVGSSLPGSGSTNQLFYNTSTYAFYYWNGTSWVNTTSSSSGMSWGASLPGSPTSGELFYNTSTLAFLYYNGSAWITISGPAYTQTLSNKRITKRVLSLGSGATPAVNTDNYDQVNITGLATGITSFTMTGTPVEGDELLVKITDNGTYQTISWGSSFEASTVALPTVTTASTMITAGFMWNSVTSKWRCVGTA